MNILPMLEKCGDLLICCQTIFMYLLMFIHDCCIEYIKNLGIMMNIFNIIQFIYDCVILLDDFYDIFD